MELFPDDFSTSETPSATNSGPACRQGHHAPHDRNGVVRQVHEIVHQLRRRELGRHEFGTKCGKETVVG